MNDAIIRTEKLTKIYDDGYRTVALEDVNLEIARGSLSCIMGPSGHGKSTLLHLIGGLDRPTSGKVYLDGLDLTALGSNHLADVRSRRLGFVFQFFNLLPALSVTENIEIAMMLAGVAQSKQRQRAMDLLGLVGLEDKRNARPNQLSGGQRQRVAIARAMVNDPVILLMDEPSGNLDSRSEEQLLQNVRNVNERGTTIVIVTHSQTVAAIAERIYRIQDGRLETHGGRNARPSNF